MTIFSHDHALTRPCPSWCDLPPGHPWELLEWEPLEGTFRIHVHTIGAGVSLTRVEMLDGTVLPPTIDVEDTDDLGAERARQLAAHLLTAAELLESAR